MHDPLFTLETPGLSWLERQALDVDVPGVIMSVIHAGFGTVFLMHYLAPEGYQILGLKIRFTVTAWEGVFTFMGQVNALAFVAYPLSLVHLALAFLPLYPHRALWSGISASWFCIAGIGLWSYGSEHGSISVSVSTYIGLAIGCLIHAALSMLKEKQRQNILKVRLQLPRGGSHGTP